MTKPDLSALLAKNLQFFMQRSGCPYPNANALGKAAGISPSSVRHYLEPQKRPASTRKPVGFPTLDKLAAIADKLGVDVWELLHPDIERSLSEREMYRRIELDYLARVKEKQAAQA